MIKFSFEVPLAHLHDFHELQDYHFALSFLFHNEEYVRYMKECSNNGDYLVIDNSFNELKRAEPLSKLTAIYEEYSADAIVCPDADEFKAEEQITSYESAVEALGRQAVYAVARWPEEFKQLEERSPSVTAVPYEYRMFLPLNELPHGRLHFLGLNNISEVLTFRPVSVDTSMPVKLIFHGMTVKEWIMEGCPHFHTAEMSGFFDAVLTKAQVEEAKSNIKLIKEVCNGGDLSRLR